MKSVKRWDVVVGLTASLVAIAGLLLSMALGNTGSLGFGHLSSKTQEFLISLASLFLFLVMIKALLRYCGRNQPCVRK